MISTFRAFNVNLLFSVNNVDDTTFYFWAEYNFTRSLLIRAKHASSLQAKHSFYRFLLHSGLRVGSFTEGVILTYRYEVNTPGNRMFSCVVH